MIVRSKVQSKVHDFSSEKSSQKSDDCPVFSPVLVLALISDRLSSREEHVLLLSREEAPLPLASCGYPRKKFDILAKLGGQFFVKVGFYTRILAINAGKGFFFSSISTD